MQDSQPAKEHEARYGKDLGGSHDILLLIPQGKPQRLPSHTRFEFSPAPTLQQMPRLMIVYKLIPLLPTLVRDKAKVITGLIRFILAIKKLP